jgi:hypothetical protein
MISKLNEHDLEDNLLRIACGRITEKLASNSKAEINTKKIFVTRNIRQWQLLLRRKYNPLVDKVNYNKYYLKVVKGITSGGCVIQIDLDSFSHIIILNKQFLDNLILNPEEYLMCLVGLITHELGHIFKDSPYDQKKADSFAKENELDKELLLLLNKINRNSEIQERIRALQ